MYSNSLRLLYLVSKPSHFIFVHKSNYLFPLLLRYKTTEAQRFSTSLAPLLLLYYCPQINRVSMSSSHIIILLRLISPPRTASSKGQDRFLYWPSCLCFWLHRERPGGLPEHRWPNSEGEGPSAFQVWGVGWEREGNLVQERSRSQVWCQNKHHTYWQVMILSCILWFISVARIQDTLKFRNVLTSLESTSWPLITSNLRMRETTPLCRMDMLSTSPPNSISWVTLLLLLFITSQAACVISYFFSSQTLMILSLSISRCFFLFFQRWRSTTCHVKVSWLHLL